MGQRRRAREYALQMLFQIDLSGGTPDEIEQDFWSDLVAGDSVRRFARELVEGVVRSREELDRWLRGSTEHWRIERMAVVDRNVLRMAAFELIGGGEAPAVIIDEAIEVAKKFGSSDSGGFINGVLDSLRRRIDAGEIPRGGGEAIR